MIVERNRDGEIEISLDEGESFSHNSIHYKRDEGNSIRIHNVESLRLDDSLKADDLTKGYTEHVYPPF